MKCCIRVPRAELAELCRTHPTLTALRSSTRELGYADVKLRTRAPSRSPSGIERTTLTYELPQGVDPDRVCLEEQELHSPMRTAIVCRSSGGPIQPALSQGGTAIFRPLTRFGRLELIDRRTLRIRLVDLHVSGHGITVQLEELWTAPSNQQLPGQLQRFGPAVRALRDKATGTQVGVFYALDGEHEAAPPPSPIGTWSAYPSGELYVS